MNRNAGLSMAMIVLTLMAGCTTSPSSRFYTLSAVQLVEPQPGTPAIAIAIDPVTVPELVDRPQIVTTLDANRVSINEFARWAEPLKRQIARVLAADLAQSFPGAIVSTYPQRVDENACRVSVDVQDVGSSASGTVALEVIWTVRASGRGMPVRGRTVVHEAVGGPGYDALVVAYSRALGAVAGDIAVAVRAETGG